MKTYSINLPIERDELGAELNFEIEFTYTPDEPRTRDYPGSPGEVEVVAVHLLSVLPFGDCPELIDVKAEEARALEHFSDPDNDTAQIEMVEHAIASDDYDDEKAAEAAHEAWRISK